jgi:hypothetical protein
MAITVIDAVGHHDHYWHLTNWTQVMILNVQTLSKFRRHHGSSAQGNATQLTIQLHGNCHDRCYCSAESKLSSSFMCVVSLVLDIMPQYPSANIQYCSIP